MDKRTCPFMKTACNAKCALFVNEYLSSGGECAIVVIGDSVHEISYVLQGEAYDTPVSKITDCLNELSNCIIETQGGVKAFMAERGD